MSCRVLKAKFFYVLASVDNLVALGALVHQSLKVFVLLSSLLEYLAANSKTYFANIPTQGPSEVKGLSVDRVVTLTNIPVARSSFCKSTSQVFKMCNG